MTNPPFPGASSADDQPPGGPPPSRPFDPSTYQPGAGAPQGYQAGYPPGYGPPPAPPKKSNTGKVVLIIVLALVGLCFVMGLIGVLAGGGTKTTTTGSGDATPAVSESKAPDAPAAPSLGTSKDNPAPIGTEVSPAKDWTIKVTGADLDATKELTAANPYNVRTKGDKLIKVMLSVHNGSSRPEAPFTQLKVGVLPKSGVKVEQSFVVVGVPTIDLMKQLQPGATLAGDMVFELPPADVDGAVLLVEPQITLDVNEDQRFLALK